VSSEGHADGLMRRNNADAGQIAGVDHPGGSAHSGAVSRLNARRRRLPNDDALLIGSRAAPRIAATNRGLASMLSMSRIAGPRARPLGHSAIRPQPPCRR
jgi:hypothetical protein